MSVYFSQPCPIPYHIIHPQFFLFFSKKLHNALWKIEHIGRKYSLPLIQEQALYLIFYGEHSMNHSLILKISSLLPPGSCGGPDTDLKLDIMKLNSYIIQLTVYLCIFWYNENIWYKIIILISRLGSRCLSLSRTSHRTAGIKPTQTKPRSEFSK